MIAALYIDPRGPYMRMARVLPYALSENQLLPGFGGADARAYDGPFPVVAHPPCGPWSSLRRLYKGTTADRACAIRAVEQVRRFGGVLEHPGTSLLWDEVIEPLRSVEPYFRDEYTVKVDQCEWGHPARKPTKLFLVGVPRSALEVPPFPGRKPTHWCSGSRKNKGGGSVPAGIKVCSAEQRRRTPTLFAEYLVRLASAVRTG